MLTSIAIKIPPFYAQPSQNPLKPSKQQVAIYDVIDNPKTIRSN